jgi:transposase
MEMIAHDPSAAKRLGVPQSVGKDFVAADKGKTFKGKRKGRPGRISGMHMETDE